MNAGWEGALFSLSLFVGATGCFERLLGRLSKDLRGSELLFWSAAIGLGAVSYGVALVGCSWGLHRLAYSIFLIGMLAIGARPFFGNLANIARSLRMWWGQAPRAERAMAIPALIVLILSLAAAMAPEVGQDSLCYHLMQPKNYVEAGKVYLVPYSVNAGWPFLSHMLFTYGMLLQGPESAKILHWIFYVLTALAAGCLAKRLWGMRAAWIAGACYLVTPAAFLQAGYAYIDHALAFYVFISFYASMRWCERKESCLWAWLAGIAAGLAASVKLIGLFSVLPVVLVMATSYLDHRSFARVLKGMIIAGTGAVIAGSFWYIRSWILLGNPVYPFYYKLFGGHGFETPTFVDAHGRPGILGFLSSPIDITLHPLLFGGETIGPLFLAAAPLFLIFMRNMDTFRIAAAFLSYAALWYIVDPNIRFFYAAIAWSSLLVAAAAEGWRRACAPAWQRTLRLALLGFMVFQSMYAVYHFTDEVQLLVRGDAARDIYLRKNEKTHVLSRQINAHLSSEEWIISASDIRGFYYEPKFTLAGDFECMVPEVHEDRSPEAFAAFLRAHGFTHAMLFGDGRRSDTMLEKVIRSQKNHPHSPFKLELIIKADQAALELYSISAG